MMIAYELHRPRPDTSTMDLRHEVILLAQDDGDVMRLLALISMFNQGVLAEAIDAAISHAASQQDLVDDDRPDPDQDKN